MEFANVSERMALSPELAVSTVIFALRDADVSDAGRKELWLPLVRRTREPFKGRWALPGGPLGGTQALQDAAAANLRSTTGLVPRYLEQLYAFGGLDRSPSRRVVSIVYWALVRESDAGAHPARPEAGTRPVTGADGEPGPTSVLREDPNVAWFAAGDEAVLDGLAFDHADIVRYALWRLRNKVAYGSIAHRLLGERFTLAQVREVYEAVLGRSLDPANFRRQLLASPGIVETGEFLQGGKHRPPRLYRYVEPEPAGIPDPG
ncbi:NrtR DNA-binding winged helix domain-containing protein [Zafaria sp. Z1313]|uniref:NUDIX hydrolase n=1 Tax=unclassified Zafaria TaxID=2828765 RepID=UPI002E77DA0B|nr:NUDIX domain-containing protein [Zafaria sp. J156]MEE1620799.1 NUDIX domain-containing protein [Zafaria sp. J156]